VGFLKTPLSNTFLCFRHWTLHMALADTFMIWWQSVWD